jgi:hypothetical protein
MEVTSPTPSHFATTAAVIDTEIRRAAACPREAVVIRERDTARNCPS